MEFFNTFLGKIISVFFGAMVPVGEAFYRCFHTWKYGSGSVYNSVCPQGFRVDAKKSGKLDKLVVYFEKKAEKHRSKVEKSKFWGLMILVAIPLPGTGAWTGALVAAMLEMRLKDAIPAIFLGVIAAGIIVALVTTGVVTLAF